MLSKSESAEPPRCRSCGGTLHWQWDGHFVHVVQPAPSNCEFVVAGTWPEPKADGEVLKPEWPRFAASVRREAFKEIEAFIAVNGREADIQSFVEKKICELDESGEPAPKEEKS